MTALLLPFATRRADGLLVGPEEVERGLACDCTCPGCEHRVVARQGTEKVWHFAHHRAPICSDGYEKSVHELAKQLLRDRTELLLPVLEATVSAPDAYGRRLEERERVFESKPVRLDECRAAVKLNNVTVDVLGRLQGHEVLVEVTVFHRLMPDKEARLVATGIASFEIDLSRFKTLQATRRGVEEALFEDSANRRWLFHPKLAAAESVARERLQGRLAEIREQHETALREREAKLRANRPEHRPELGHLSMPPRVGALYRSQQPDGDATARDPIWRAGFPDEGDIRRAQVALAKRIGKSLIEVIRVTTQATKREHLQGFTPDELAARWAGQLGVDSQELMQFFEDAFYTLAY